MSRSVGPLLRARRVRDLLALIGSCGEVAYEERAEFLVGGILRLFDARAALTVLAYDYTLEGTLRVERVAASGFDNTYGERYLASVESSACEDPVVALAAGLGDGAYRRRDIIDDRAWYATRWVVEDFREAGLDDGIYARVGLDERVTECIAVFRPPGARPFTAEDRVLMELFADEVPRLVRPRVHPMIADARRALSPREAQTLERLCRGESEKQVATTLGISRNTVHVYVKALYRHFGVGSRSELLARFIGEGAPSPTEAPRWRVSPPVHRSDVVAARADGLARGRGSR